MSEQIVFGESEALQRVPAVEVRNLSVAFPEHRGVVETLLMGSKLPLLIEYLRELWPDSERLKALQRVHPVLKNVSFKIERGSVFGIVGLNGAGKSTLLYALCNLLPAQSGEVFLFGQSVETNPEFVGKCLFRSSTKELNVENTAMENIEFVARLYSADLEAAKKAATTVLRYLGLSEQDICEKQVKQLSWGTKGKVALVRSLIVPLIERESGAVSPIILLDEPTAGFDVLAVQEFFEGIREIKRRVPELTIVIGTNDPRELAFCDDGIAISAEKHETSSVSPRLMSELRRAMETYAGGVDAMAAMISGGQPSNRNAQTPELVLYKVPAQKQSVLRTIAWRHFVELKHNSFLTISVIVGIVIPQMLAIFSSAAAKGFFGSCVCGMLGIFASVLIREYMRTLDRERSIYKTIETVLVSPVPLSSFWMNTNIVGTIAQACYALCAALILSGLLYLQAPAEAANGLAKMTHSDLLGVAAVLVGSTIACAAIGLLFAFLPFLIRGEVAFFLTGMLPSMLLLFSAVYYPVESMPNFVRPFLQWNPFTHAAQALTGFVHSNETLNATAWQSIRSLYGISIGFLIVSIYLSRFQFRLLRFAGKFRKID